MKLNKFLYWLKQSGHIWYNHLNGINIVGKPNELTKTIDCLKKEFEMRDLRKTKFCLRLEIEYLNKGVFVYQEVDIMKVLKRF